MAKTSGTTLDSLNLSPLALDFLGVQQQPFSSNILSSDAIYSDATLEQFKDTIKHHLQFSDLILVAEGDLGSGKTTLFRQLIQSEIANSFLMPVHAEATDTLTQIQQKMSIHLKDQGEANYLDDNLKNLQMFDQTPVLLIDDAHVLSDTTLQEIIRYRQQLFVEKEVPLKILFLANKGMANTIEQVSDIQHKQLSIQPIPELTPKQIEAYLRHKLSKAGSQQSALFDQEKIQQIYKKSNGNPSLAMQEAIVVLEKMAKRKMRSFNIKPLGKPVILFSFLVLVVSVAIAAFFYFSPGKIEQQHIVAPLPKPLPENITTAEPTVFEQDQQSTTELVDESTTQKLVDELANDTTPTGTAVEETNQIPGSITEEPSTEIVPPPESEITLDNPPIVETKNSQVISTPQPTQTNPKPAKEALKAPTLAAEPLKKPNIETAALPTIKPSLPKEELASPAIKQLAQLGIKDKTWLNQQNPKHYTLQILGARDPETLIKFVRQHGIKADTAWYATNLKGKPWYVLVHRFYTNKDVARQSIARLPKGLQEARPWVKSVASIHKITR